MSATPPPEISPELLHRSFKARNGEYAWRIDDLAEVLTAYATAGSRALYWELWIIDHRTDPSSVALLPDQGSWCGLIPMKDGTTAVFGGQGRIVRAEIEASGLDDVSDPWRSFLRVNLLG